MANVYKAIRVSLLKNGKTPTFNRFFSNIKLNSNPNNIPLKVASIFGGSVALYTFYKWRERQVKTDTKVMKAVKLTKRERRFMRFASVEYDGQVYMTPQDFLESVVEAQLRPRYKRKVLMHTDIEAIRNETPFPKEGSPRLFRNLGDQGIVSYTEYLFLLSILTKPQSGFRIAFNIIDTDGDEKVGKTEFLVMEQIFSHVWKSKRGVPIENKLLIEEEYVNDEQGLQRKHSIDTTLMIYFFGHEGKDKLNFEKFYQFMLYLQKEVLEFEFSEFSKGLPTISVADFARILLRYTSLDSDDYDYYLDRIKETRGISFDDFHIFCQFLNNLGDFYIAMRMYNLAGHSISKDEFHRAVKICTGKNVSPHLVHIVFSLFDENEDGLLSYREFIAIMKHRLHRGLKLSAIHEGWDAFKSCVKRKMSHRKI